MIKISIYSNNWRIQIGDEIWEFETKKEFIEVLTQLISFKDKYGRLK